MNQDNAAYLAALERIFVLHKTHSDTFIRAHAEMEAAESNLSDLRGRLLAETAKKGWERRVLVGGYGISEERFNAPRNALALADQTRPGVFPTTPTLSAISSLKGEIEALVSTIDAQRKRIAAQRATSGVVQKAQKALKNDFQNLAGIVLASFAFTGIVHLGRVTKIVSTDMITLSFYLAVWSALIFLGISLRDSLVLRVTHSPLPTGDTYRASLQDQLRVWLHRSRKKDRLTPVMFFAGMSFLIVGITWPLDAADLYNPTHPLFFKMGILIGLGLIIGAGVRTFRALNVVRGLLAWVKIHHPRNGDLSKVPTEIRYTYPQILHVFGEENIKRNILKGTG